MSDRTKAKKLNNNVDQFWYTINGREYVHGTTIVSAVYETIRPRDVTVALRVPLTSGFTFGLDNTLQSVGWVSFENTCLFITPTSTSLHVSSDLLPSQQYLLYLNEVAQEAAGSGWSYYSKRLTVDTYNTVEHQLPPQQTNIVRIDERNFQVRMMFGVNNRFEGYTQHAYIR